MKRILLLLLLATPGLKVTAQEAPTFQFDYMEDKIDFSSLSSNSSYEHFLGERIGKKMALLSQSYTWEEPPTPITPTARLVVEKPTIYYNIKKIEKYYKKAVKKNEVSGEEAIKEFERIIDIALLIRYQQTESLESHLGSIKEEQEMVSLFTDKIQLNYY